MSVVLIPAYNPDISLINVVNDLLKKPRFQYIIVVNDGSAEDCNVLFDHLAALSSVVVLRHAINLGKGAALKTGINYFCCEFPNSTGVVTADADGQHLAEDVEAVAARLEDQPNSLILGARQFDTNVPLRSQLGNTLTKYIFRILVGTWITDTQTGLRGIPRHLARELLSLPTNGYEFELDMLLLCKNQQVPIVEQPIKTVYLDDNASSHFNPLSDSLKIYFVLMRFVMASLASAAVDYLIFIVSFIWLSNILFSHASARAVALFVNWTLVRNAVFRSRKPASDTFPKFVLLVVCLGGVSYGLIRLFVHSFGLDVITAKIVSELLVYFVNFTIQRDLIFQNPLTVTDQTARPDDTRRAA
jgi:glycosyltransferase involved in cell wall biosynthesis